MKKENRKFQVRSANYIDDIADLPQLKNFYNLPDLLIYKKRKFILSCGKSDNLSFFRDGDNFIILSTNFGLQYAGLQIIDPGQDQDQDQDCSYDEDNIFFQNLEDLEYLKKDFFDYSENNQAEFLYQYHNY